MEPKEQTWQEILQEAMAVIPALTGQWTDFNPQDTGMVLLELMAALTEMQRYYLDQVGDRFFVQYLRLLTGSSADTVAELLEEYRRQENRLSRAVTPGDIRRILLRQHPQLGLSRCHVEWSGLDIRVLVYRDQVPLLPEEMEDIREILEYYRLLTMRITVEQVPCRELEASCTVRLKPQHRDVSALRREIGAFLKQNVGKKQMHLQLNVESIRSYILAMPDVQGIEALNFYDTTTGDLLIMKQEYAVFYLSHVDVILLEDGAGHETAKGKAKG